MNQVREAVIDEMHGNEIDIFALVPDLPTRIESLDSKQENIHQTKLQVDSDTGEFNIDRFLYLCDRLNFEACKVVWW